MAGEPYVIGEGCVDITDRACVDVVPACPVDAIYPADTVPTAERDFIDINRFVFAESSSL